MTFTKQLSSNGEIDITGDLAAGHTIDIKSHLTGPVSIGDGGLKGQIIVNSGDLGSSWTGNVTVGNTTLSPEPAYTQSGLGGGAVGLVPFDCHLQDCDPEYSGPNFPTLGGGPDGVPFEVTLRHYGPVTWGSGAMPVTIEFCDSDPCDFHVDVSDDFEVTNAAGTRDVVIKPKAGESPGVGRYHYSPVLSGSDQLECHGISASGVVGEDYTYTIQYDS